MAQMNTGRIVMGGLAAGLVMNIVDAVTNGFVAGGRWLSESNALNPGLVEKAGAGSTVGWIIVDFLLGIITVWVYAGIRPRLGPGPKTALAAAFVVWLVGHLFFASYVFMGLFSAGLIAMSSAGGLVAALAGGWLGGLLYRE
jgi:hypothetical protein